MELRTVSLIVLAAVAALTIVFYQYYYKNPRKGSLKIQLAALRFVTLFSGLLLLVNPKFVHRDYYLEKPNLIVLVDNSESMRLATQPQVLSEAIFQIKENPEMANRFSIHQYGFGQSIQPTDSINFEQKNTDISNAFSTIDKVFLKGNNAVVLLSDGNQTYGRDYEFKNLNPSITMYPIVMGDTTKYEDVSIGLINANKYAFLNNKFPIETTVNYQGKRSINTTVTVSINGTRVHQEQVLLSSSDASKTIQVLTTANKVGVQTIKVDVGALENEKNTANNSMESAIEVIDEKTNVLIVSDELHPDIGALKKSIESNEQRTVTTIKPANIGALENADLLILYQPRRNFKAVYDFIGKSGIHYFTITGSQTDWNFLNGVQQSFGIEGSRQSEEIIPVLNNAFGIFGLGEFNVDGYPPLEGNLGDIELKMSHDNIMFQQIKGVTLNSPLFTILTEGKHREAVLFGENIWRWRVQCYRNDQNFKKFDDFMGNLMVYLASNNQRSRLDLEYEVVFDNAAMAKIQASYFDESYQFDPSATISILIEGKQNDFERESPMLLKGSYYEVDLSDLDAGEYNFTVTVQDDNLKKSGAFKILDFDPETQQTAANYPKLSRLAEKTGGNTYFFNDLEALKEKLLSSQQFVPVQKSKENIVSLIDFRILLGLMALSLALEWFIRKYNGLI